MTQDGRCMVTCPECGRERSVSAETARLHPEPRRCQSCAAKAAPKPQNSAAYWTDDRRATHGATMRASESYRAGIANRPSVSGAANPMFGRTASEETRAKMSAARTGKLGPNATAWKGGRGSLLARLKKIIHERFGWYRRVYERDGFRCVRCGAGGQIDAHHIRPLNVIVRELLRGQIFGSDEATLEWLAAQDAVADPLLTNGETLCRAHHREAHGQSWGSHAAA